MKIYGKIYGLGLEIGLQKVVLDSRDSVALETWFEKDIRADIRTDIRTWFETWFEKKIVLENWFEIWFEKDIRTDIRLRFATDVRIDIRADVRTDIRIDIRADARTDMRTALGHAPLLICTPNTPWAARQPRRRSRRALAHSGRGLLQAASPCC